MGFERVEGCERGLGGVWEGFGRGAGCGRGVRGQ